MEKKTNKSKELRIEDYISKAGLIDAESIMKVLNVSIDEINEALLGAISRGIPLYCVNNIIFRANSRDEFERKLIRIWKMGTVEYADGKSLTTINNFRIGD